MGWASRQESNLRRVGTRFRLVSSGRHETRETGLRVTGHVDAVDRHDAEPLLQEFGAAGRGVSLVLDPQGQRHVGVDPDVGPGRPDACHTVDGYLFDAVDGGEHAGDTGFEGLGPATRDAQ